MDGVCDQGESALLLPDEYKVCGNGELDEGEACADGAASRSDNAYRRGVDALLPRDDQSMHRQRRTPAAMT